MEKKFSALDLAPLVQEIVKETQNHKAQAIRTDDEVTERIFIGSDGAELEILRWSQHPEFFIN